MSYSVFFLIFVFNFFNLFFLHALPKNNTAQPYLNIVFLTKECLTTVLLKGTYELIVYPDIEGPICGLIPAGEPCQNVSTTGLKWNLGKDKKRKKKVEFIKLKKRRAIFTIDYSLMRILI